MVSRRKFLKGSAALFTLAGTGITLGLSNNQQQLKNIKETKTLVHLFFRGGMDALNFLVPRTGVNRQEYESKRPNIQIPIDKTLNLNNSFGISDKCPELHQLYQQGKMAMIHAVGMPDGLSSRSHFESQDMFDHGIPGNADFESGWLARHINSSGGVSPQAVIPSMSPGNPPISHQGDANILSIDDPNSVHPNSGKYQEEHLATLEKIYSGTSQLDKAMNSTIDNIKVITDLELSIPEFYPDNSLAQKLGLIAQIIKSDLGLHVSSIDFGGWDTHENSGNQGTGYYVDRLGIVSSAVGAFFQDLTAAGKSDKVVLTTQTDFGRRVRENGNRGTDHGTAQAMMVVGGLINGGNVFGTFPGIADGDLYRNTDLQMTTDFRQPLSDVVKNFLGNSNIKTVFPGYTGSQNIGLFPEDEIFKSGFDG